MYVCVFVFHRAKEFFLGDEEGNGSKVMPVLLHGDAAIAGQGIVYETMQMAQLKNYKVCVWATI